MSDYGVQRCQITEIVFCMKVLVNDILVRLKRIWDYAGVGLERCDCTVCEGVLEEGSSSFHGIWVMLIKAFHTIDVLNFKSILTRYEGFKYKCNFLMYVIYYIYLAINGNLLTFTLKLKNFYRPLFLCPLTYTNGFIVSFKYK